MFNLFVWYMEHVVAYGGCVVNELWEQQFVAIWHGVAVQYAGMLSACARAFFGI